MKNLFERHPFRRALKNYRSNLAPIQVPTARVDIGPKDLLHLVLDLPVFIGQRTSSFVRIEKFAVGHYCTESAAKTALAGGDPAGDSNRWHLRWISVRAED